MPRSSWRENHDATVQDVRINPVAPGNYSGTLTISSNGGSVTIPISLTVTAPPQPTCITVDQNSVFLTVKQGQTTGQNVVFTNCGQVTGNVSIVANAANGSGWLSVLKTYEHAKVNLQFYQDQKHLKALQGRDNLWLAGLYMHDIDYHERAIVSAFKIAGQPALDSTILSKLCL